MATYTAARAPGTIVRQLESPQFEGYEGQALDKTIRKVIRDEPIKRLIQAQGTSEIKYYLDSLRSEAQSTNEAEFTVAVVNYSWQVWQALSDYFLGRGWCLEVPDACPGHSNNFMYTWSRAEHYLECEIFGSDAVEFFYRNRKSGEVWGEDTTLEHGFSTAIFEKAALFTW